MNYINNSINKEIANIANNTIDLFEVATNSRDLELMRDTLIKKIMQAADSVAETYNLGDYETPTYFRTTIEREDI